MSIPIIASLYPIKSHHSSCLNSDVPWFFQFRGSSGTHRDNIHQCIAVSILYSMILGKMQYFTKPMPWATKKLPLLFDTNGLIGIQNFPLLTFSPVRLQWGHYNLPGWCYHNLYQIKTISSLSINCEQQWYFLTTIPVILIPPRKNPMNSHCFVMFVAEFHL